MSRPVDTTTKEPWPAVWSNRMLQEIRGQAITDLRARSVGRGVPENGQCYTMEVEGEGENRTETATVDRALSSKRHTQRELRQLFQARWARFCSDPQDLATFIAQFETPDAAQLDKLESAAASVEESLLKEVPVVAPVVSVATAEPDKPRRGPGRPKKPAEPVEA